MSIMICDKCSRSIDTDRHEIIELVNPNLKDASFQVCESCYLDTVEDIRQGKQADLYENGKSIAWQIANDNL